MQSLKKLLFLFLFIPLLAHAQLPALKDTTLITPSTSVTPQWRYSYFGGDMILQSFINGKYYFMPTNKYLSKYYASKVKLDSISNKYVAKMPSGFGASITGTGGNGFVDLTSQSLSPSSATSHLRLYADSLNRLSWKNTNYRRTIRVTRPSDMTITMPYRLNPVVADSTDFAGFRPVGVKLPFTNQQSVVITKYDSLYLANYGNNPKIVVYLKNDDGTYTLDNQNSPNLTYLNQANPATAIHTISFKYPVNTTGYVEITGSPDKVPVSPPNNNIQYYTLGNSITFGATTTDPSTQSYPAQMQASLGGLYHLTNLGVTGYSTAQINALEVPTAIAGFDPVNYGYHVAIVAGGTNDFRLGVSAATSYANFKKTCQQLIAAGYKVIVVTPPALNNSVDVINNDPVAAEAIRQQLITLLRNNYQTDLGASGIADWAANSIVGTYVGPGNQNLTYYNADGTHFTPVGYGLLASIVKPVLLQVIAGGSGPDVKLANLQISNGVFTPSFSPTVNNYIAYVPNGTTSITVTPSINSTGQTVTINGVSATFSSPFTTPFTNGMSVVANVTSSDGALSGSYSVKVYQETAPYLDYSASNVNIQASTGTGNWTSSSTGYATTVASMSGNGYTQFQRSTTNNDQVVVGLDSNPILTNWLVSGVYNWDYGFYFNGGVINVVKGNSQINTGIAVAVGYYRLNRTSGTVSIQYSSDNTSYSTVYTFSGSSTATLYSKMAITVANKVLQGAVQSGFNH